MTSVKNSGEAKCSDGCSGEHSEECVEEECRQECTGEYSERWGGGVIHQMY